MSRFFVPPENIVENSIILDKPEDIRHISRVLRLKEGDTLDIFDNSNWEYVTNITSINDSSINLEILDRRAFSREPDIDIALFQGIPKHGKMDTVVRKSVELGVKKIVPVFMKRTVVVDKGKFGNKIERWRKISVEAAKQCRRGIVPEVSGAVYMDEMLEMLPAFDYVIFSYENEENLTIKDCLRNITGGAGKSIALIIGPEGGFADSEADEIKSMGAYSVTLGKTILRTETAGIAAIAMIMYELEM